MRFDPDFDFAKPKKNYYNIYFTDQVLLVQPVRVVVMDLQVTFKTNTYMYAWMN